MPRGPHLRKPRTATHRKVNKMLAATGRICQKDPDECPYPWSNICKEDPFRCRKEFWKHLQCARKVNKLVKYECEKIINQ